VEGLYGTLAANAHWLHPFLNLPTCCWLPCPLPLQRFFVEGLYGTLAANARPTTASYNIDRQGLLQLGVDYELSS
jgi:hypothetical protein